MYCRLALLVATAVGLCAPAMADAPVANPGPCAVSSASGYTYTAFGTHYVPKVLETVAQRYTFTGREASQASAAAPVYYRYRMYSPEIARFTARDPMLDEATASSLYPGMAESAVNYGDPWGLGEWVIRADGVWEWVSPEKEEAKREQDQPKKTQAGRWELPAGATESVGPESGLPPRYAYRATGDFNRWYGKVQRDLMAKTLDDLVKEVPKFEILRGPVFKTDGRESQGEVFGPYTCPGGLYDYESEIKKRFGEAIVGAVRKYVQYDPKSAYTVQMWRFNNVVFERERCDETCINTERRYQRITVKAMNINWFTLVPPRKALDPIELADMGQAAPLYPEAPGKQAQNPINPLYLKVNRESVRKRSTETDVETWKRYREVLLPQRQAGAVYVPYEVVTPWQDAECVPEEGENQEGNG